MTKKEAREYLNRWSLVTQVLDQELRSTPMKVKFRKMDAAYRMAIGLGFLPKMKAVKNRTLKEVRLRWLRLKTTHP